MRNRTRQLFGGTLPCAGLASAAVSAESATADFIPYAAHNFTEASFKIVTEINVSYDDFPLPAILSVDGITSRAYASATLMGANIDVTGPSSFNTAWAYVLQYFTVSQAKKVILEWDFGAAFDAFGTVYGLPSDGGSSGDIFVQLDETDGAGSMALTLQPGYYYSVQLFVHTDILTGFDDVFIRMTYVPAPGGLALMGMGLLATRQRRRRE